MSFMFKETKFIAGNNKAALIFGFVVYKNLCYCLINLSVSLEFDDVNFK